VAEEAQQAADRRRWYVVHAYSGFEKKVADSIREQARQQGLDHLFDEVLVPTEEVVEMKRGQKVSSERKFFPGYVLARMAMTDQTWHLVKNTPKVTGFLGARGKPSPISDGEAERILNQVREGVESPKPSVTFEVGEQVRVGARGRRPLHLVHGVRGRGRHGARAREGGGVHLRPLDARGAGVLPGREAGLSGAGSSPRHVIPRRARGAGAVRSAPTVPSVGAAIRRTEGPFEPSDERVPLWQRRSSARSSWRSRRGRPIPRRRLGRRWVSAGSTSWSSARPSTRPRRTWSRARPRPSSSRLSRTALFAFLGPLFSLRDEDAAGDLLPQACGRH